MSDVEQRYLEDFLAFSLSLSLSFSFQMLIIEFLELYARKIETREWDIWVRRLRAKKKEKDVKKEKEEKKRFASR